MQKENEVYHQVYIYEKKKDEFEEKHEHLQL